MSNQSGYTAEEWKTLITAPLAAALVVTVSDVSGPIGLVKEALAVSSELAESASSSSTELIKSIAGSLKSRGSKPELPDLPRDSPESVKNAVIDLCKQAAAIVGQKSPTEADEYKRWLVSLAQKAAEAAKEGGFLGIGGTLVSEEESAAVKALAAAMGVSGG